MHCFTGMQRKWHSVRSGQKLVRINHPPMRGAPGNRASLTCDHLAHALLVDGIAVLIGEALQQTRKAAADLAPHLHSSKFQRQSSALSSIRMRLCQHCV